MPSLPEGKQGACQTISPSESANFHGRHDEQVYAARRYCAVCPIRQECLTTALSLPAWQTKRSTWGGYTANQRESIRKGQEIPPPSPLPAAVVAPRKTPQRATSEYRGVTRYGNQWKASIRVGKRCRYLGLFHLTPEGEREAAMAYDRAAWEYKGLEAKLNFSRAEVAGYDAAGEKLLDP